MDRVDYNVYFKPSYVIQIAELNLTMTRQAKILLRKLINFQAQSNTSSCHK